MDYERAGEKEDVKDVEDVEDVVFRQRLTGLFFKVYLGKKGQSYYKLSRNPFQGVSGLSLPPFVAPPPLEGVGGRPNDGLSRILEVLR